MNTNNKPMWGVRMANNKWFTTHPAFSKDGTTNPNLAGVFSEEEAKQYAAAINGRAAIIPYTVTIK